MVTQLCRTRPRFVSVHRDCWVIWSVGHFLDREGALLVHAGRLELAKLLQDNAEIAERLRDCGVVWSVDRFLDHEGAVLVHAGRLELAKLSQNIAQVAKRDRDPGVLGPVHGLGDRQRALEAARAASNSPS